MKSRVGRVTLGNCSPVPVLALWHQARRRPEPPRHPDPSGALELGRADGRAAGLISRLIINRVPVPLGSGTPLFGPLPGDLRLEHVRTVSYPGGLVQSELRMKGFGW